MERPETELRCPDCGSPLSEEAWGQDLCVHCLLQLAGGGPLTSAPTLGSAPPVNSLADAEASLDPTLVSDIGLISTGRPERFEFSAGQLLGERYRVLKRLGRGGMGEVWRAYDLKLRMDVALKSLHHSLAVGDESLEFLRSEVRAAREVISPNVCRLFDLVEVDGQELVSMEYIDGQTLLALLKERGPLELQEAREIGAQFLGGLEAIHQADLVHRDIKPENIMLTRAGRVVVMDFGLTSPTGMGAAAGTPAYMAPEQAKGEGTDARADVFSAAMVLAEMLSAERGPEDSSRQSFWENVRKDPPELPETPWTRILLPAVATDREKRYASAAELSRLLEEVTLRAAGDESLRPYPGLASFSEEDAEFFFGRELEVESLWKRLRHAHLLALIGPSGAGKSSFLHAGLVPARTDGTRILTAKPGPRPFAALAQALASEFADEPGVVEDFLRFEETEIAVALFTRWRERHAGALLVVDQFEELFTQSSLEVQERFAHLLSQVALETDVRVLLSMRDDFLFHCEAFEELTPVFSEITPLGALKGSSLRRALVQPALKCGYRFEDEELVDEMVAEVAESRGALPLLAFAAARLWEQRDRETGVLTREAYEQVGGVGGALAQHAEETLERIGRARVPIVRELFRNLMTAQGTRASRDRAELLSVFTGTSTTELSGAGRGAAKRARTQASSRAGTPAGGAQEAGEVLDALVDARLVTTYEADVAESDESGRQRVEIVHETLLDSWPRLVRWRAQDAEGAQLRDELRQAAQLWDGRGRPEDLLWTGTALQEFELWRERYPGRLTALEESFAEASIALSQRARRRRRNVLTAVIAALLLVAIGMTTLWRQSEIARARAEAQKLIAIGQLDLGTFPTASLAYATASLRVADTEEGRLLALEALSKGPPAWQVPGVRYGLSTRFSPDGRYVAHSSFAERIGDPVVHLIHSDGSWEALEGGRTGNSAAIFWQTEDLFLVVNPFHPEGAHWSLISASSASVIGEAITPQSSTGRWDAERGRLVVWAFNNEILTSGMSPGEEPRRVGRVPHNSAGLGPAGRWLTTLEDGQVTVREILEEGLSAPKVLGEHTETRELLIAPEANLVVSRDLSGQIRLWEMTGAEPPRTVQGPEGASTGSVLDRRGSLLHMTLRTDAEEFEHWTLHIPELELRFSGEGRLRGTALVDPAQRHVGLPLASGELHYQRLAAPDGAETVALKTGGFHEIHYPSFHPDGDWIASPLGPHLWNLDADYPITIKGAVYAFAFDPLGNFFLAAQAGGGRATVGLWPLDGEVPGAMRSLYTRPIGNIQDIYISLDGAKALIGKGRKRADRGPFLLSLEDGSTHTLEGDFDGQTIGLAVSPDGRYGAATGGQFLPEENLVKVWDLETLELVAVHDPETEIDIQSCGFTYDNDLLWADAEGLHRWNFRSGEHRRIFAGKVGHLRVSADGRIAVPAVNMGLWGALTVIDLETGEETPITTHGEVFMYDVDATGRILATLGRDGVLRMGPTTGEEPHRAQTDLDFLHYIRLDPLGRWVAIVTRGEVVLWPIPSLDGTPFHLRPLDELLAELDATTNYRLTEDPDSAGGWTLEWADFPGWEPAGPR